VVLCSKGVDIENARLISERIREIIENDIVVLSGPSFAREVALGLPCGVNVAGKNRNLSISISEHLSCVNFIVKPISDYIGLQVAGAFKNVLAVGCGVMRGLMLGDSAVAQFIVEGLDDMIRLSVALGGKSETFFELGGVGDIILTCNGQQSRNVAFGKYIAGGGALEDWQGNLAEGAFTAKSVPLFEKKHNIELKTLHEIYKSIYTRSK
jgi:glycerol-3-phosphate dehydrogenase (NAD(P)+)